MKVAFSIVAKNYIGLAKVLRDSIIKYNPDIRFYIFVADEANEDYQGEQDVFFSKKILDIPEDKWIEMSFKYTLTEFCTAIKPYCFKYIFTELGGTKVIYFDPDIYVCNSLSYFYDKLNEVSMIVVPHIVYPNMENDTDKTFLQSGIYNLGFLALKDCNSTQKMLEWWGKKLLNSCFDDVLDYTFTDQKWMNFLPALFPNDEVLVSRHLGANIAPWNFYEREMELKNGVPSFVKARSGNSEIYPILFIHYSGFNYKSLLMGNEERTRFGQYEISYQDVKDALAFYVHQISSNKEIMLSYLSLPYTYGTYDNNTLVDKVHRRLYRALAQRTYKGNPFDTKACDFYKSIKQLNMISQKSVSGVVDKTPSLRKKLRYFNGVMSLVYKIVGYNRYIALLRLLKHFSKYEAQVFLIDKKYSGSNIDLLN